MDRVLENSRIVRLVTLIIAMIVTSGCASEFERRFGEAERLRAEAAAVDSEWLQTGSLLEQAKEAAARDDLDEALALVEQAHFQAEMAIRQAAVEAEAWTGRVVKPLPGSELTQ